MLSVAVAVAIVLLPISALLWLRWRADRRRQTAKDADVQALVDATLDQAKADREKSATAAKEMGT